MRLFALMLLTFTCWAADSAKVDEALPAYQKAVGVSGNMSCVGSDTLVNLVALWAEEFRKIYPTMNVQVEGKGSGTAPPALIQGVAQLGPMSRPMKLEEIEAFEARMGYRPTAIAVALDALAVFVHADNPIEEITLTEVDGVFSKNRRGGHQADILRWSQLDVTSKLGAYPVRLYGRNSASGTYGFFKHYALFKGDFKDSVKEQPGSSSVVMAVTEDPAGIGYSGIGYMTSGVKALRVSKTTGARAYSPLACHVLNRDYPLGRMLYVYIAKPPGQPLPLAVREFLRFALSREGQHVVLRSGYIPLPAKLAARQRGLFDDGTNE